jgi:hypothetical protein
LGHSFVIAFLPPKKNLLRRKGGAFPSSNAVSARHRREKKRSETKQEQTKLTQKQNFAKRSKKDTLSLNIPGHRFSPVISDRLPLAIAMDKFNIDDPDACPTRVAFRIERNGNDLVRPGRFALELSPEWKKEERSRVFVDRHSVTYEYLNLWSKLKDMTAGDYLYPLQEERLRIVSDRRDLQQAGEDFLYRVMRERVVSVYKLPHASKRAPGLICFGFLSCHALVLNLGAMLTVEESRVWLQVLPSSFREALGFRDAIVLASNFADTLGPEAATMRSRVMDVFTIAQELWTEDDFFYKIPTSGCHLTDPIAAVMASSCNHVMVPNNPYFNAYYPRHYRAGTLALKDFYTVCEWDDCEMFGNAPVAELRRGMAYAWSMSGCIILLMKTLMVATHTPRSKRKNCNDELIRVAEIEADRGADELRNIRAIMRRDVVMAESSDEGAPSFKAAKLEVFRRAAAAGAAKVAPAAEGARAVAAVCAADSVGLQGAAGGAPAEDEAIPLGDATYVVEDADRNPDLRRPNAAASDDGIEAGCNNAWLRALLSDVTDAAAAAAAIHQAAREEGCKPEDLFDIPEMYHGLNEFELANLLRSVPSMARCCDFCQDKSKIPKKYSVIDEDMLTHKARHECPYIHSLDKAYTESELTTWVYMGEGRGDYKENGTRGEYRLVLKSDYWMCRYPDCTRRYDHLSQACPSILRICRRCRLRGHAEQNCRKRTAEQHEAIFYEHIGWNSIYKADHPWWSCRGPRPSLLDLVYVRGNVRKMWMTRAQRSYIEHMPTWRQDLEILRFLWE